MPALGRYEIEGKLGEGAMGVVYRARDRAVGRRVALKMLSDDLPAEDEILQRFRREAEAIGRLSHPNIVTVFDMGETEGHLYMAMELLEGEDLRTLIERQAPLAMADRVRVALQICEGLGYAHARGVVHRDVKPANLMVTSRGQVKILDFGLARVASRATITRRGVILGTPDYMAPEQASGQGSDHRTDLFSVGSVLYEFLTLQKPFKGRTLHAVLYQIIQSAPDPILTLNPEVPARVALLVHRMLEKDPDKRPQGLDEVARELRVLHAGLRRSGGRSVLPAPGPTGSPEERRAALRERQQRARASWTGGREGEALAQLESALALEPEDEETWEMLWQCARRLWLPAGTAPDPEHARRVGELLSAAQPGRPVPEVQRALAELALLAPDDPRVRDLLRPAADEGPGN